VEWIIWWDDALRWLRSYGSFGFTPTDDLLMMGTYMGVSMLAIGAIHWFIPMYAGDNLKKYGMVAAPIWGAFAALDGYHYAVGNQPVIA